MNHDHPHMPPLLPPAPVARHRRRAILAAGVSTAETLRTASSAVGGRDTTTSRMTPCPQCTTLIASTDDELSCVICNYTVYGVQNVSDWMLYDGHRDTEVFR